MALLSWLLTILLAAAAVPVDGLGRNSAAAWISGGLNSSLPAEVCGTCNGCTANRLFLACSSPTATIIRITFAAYGDPSQCPDPHRNNCTAHDSQTVIEKACIGRHNCTVSPKAFDQPDCLKEVAGGTVLVMAKALCSEPGLRANQLRFEFSLPAAPISASVQVSSLGYNVLLCNGGPVSSNRLEPGRTGAKRVFYSTFDLLPCLRARKNVIAAVLGNGWWSTTGDSELAPQMNLSRP